MRKINLVPADPCPVLPPVSTHSVPAPAPPPLPARPSNINIPPPIPSRTSSFAPPPPKNDEMPPLPPQVPPSAVKEEKIEVSLENRAKNLLIRRRKLYMDRSMAAKQANDRAAAIEAFETVKLFNQALGKTNAPSPALLLIILNLRSNEGRSPVVRGGP